jgi:hypothetical protein
MKDGKDLIINPDKLLSWITRYVDSSGLSSSPTQKVIFELVVSRIGRVSTG